MGHGSAFKNWLMLGNGPDDSVEPGFGGAGDCVFAGAAHETMLTNKLAGRSVRFDGKAVISDYSACTGYRVGDDSTDNGTEVREGLKYRAKVGVIDADGNRHTIGAYVRLNPKDWTELMQAVYVFTCVGIGFAFPSYAMDQFDARKPWDYRPGVDDNPQEGHYVPIVGRSTRLNGAAVSWARRQTMTQAFYTAYNDEAWGIIYPEELVAGKTERGYGLSQLTTFLHQLR